MVHMVHTTRPIPGAPTPVGSDWGVDEDLATGRLVCACNPNYDTVTFCEHIERVYNERLDKLEWLSTVEVILFKDPLFAIELEVGAMKPSGDRPVSLSWRTPTVQAQYRNDDNTQPFIGFIRDGEGRKTLRAMVLDWLAGYGNLKCTSGLHEPTQTRTDRYIEIWQLLTQSGFVRPGLCECTPCVNKRLALVPDF